MQVLITKIEKARNNSNSWLAKIYYSLILVCLYFSLSIVSLWHLLFSPPQKSFVLLYQQNNDGLWKKSYYDHLRYRHNVRFSSISFTLLLVTIVVAGQMLLGLILPLNQVEITYADTFNVTNTNNDGVGSLRRALQLANLNAGADTVDITVSGTLTLLSNLIVPSDITIDASGVDFIISGDSIMRLGGSNITIDNLQFANSGITVIDAYDNITLTNLVMNGSDLNKAISFSSGGSNNEIVNATIANYLTGVDIQNADNLEISGGSFSDCDHEGIYINNSQDITIGNASLFDNGWAGVNIDNSVSAIYIHHSQIYNNSINGINFNSFGNDGSGVNSLFTANDIYSNTLDGINLQDIEGATDFEITGNDIYSNDRSGIFLTNVDDVTIGSNNIYSNNDGMSVVQGSDGNSITFNSIYSNTNNGISLQEAVNNNIGNNYIGTNNTLADLGNNQYGIDLSVDTTHDNLIGPSNTIIYNNVGVVIHQDSYGNTIRQNDISQNDTIGIFLQESSDNTIGPDNTITNNSDEGIRAEENGANTISNNVISGNSYGVSLTPDSDSNTISDNEVYSNSESGISIKSNSNTISGNYIGTDSGFADLGNTEDGITFNDGSSSNIMQNNYLYYNDLNGIAFLGASVNNTVSGNEIKQNNLNGVSIRGSSNSNTIGPNNTVTNNVNYGIEVTDSDYNQITQNIINSNSDENIHLNNGNEDLAAPVILTAIASTNKFVVSGTAAENDGKVEIFGSDTQNAANGYLEQGSFSDGTFDIEKPEDITATHTYLTATFTDSNNNTSEFASLELTIDNTAPVSSASITGGTYSGTQIITLSATDENDEQPKIFYTTDGSTPTIDDSLLYSEAISISETTTLKFFAKDNVNNSESVHTEEYIIESEDINININENVNTNENVNESFLSVFEIGNVSVDKKTEKVRTTDTTPTFTFSNIPEVKVGSKIIVKIKQRKQDILILTQKVNKYGRAVITVPDDEDLDKGSYNVFTGIVGEDNLDFRIKLQVIDFPPNLDLISAVITQEDLYVASTAEKIIASLWDSAQIVAASSSESDEGIFTIQFPFWPSSGEYTFKAKAVSNNVSSDEEIKTVYLTPNQYVNTLVAIPGDEKNKYRLTYVNPRVAGLALAGETPIIYLDDVEQGNAIIQQPCSGTCSWYYELSSVSTGVHYLRVVNGSNSYTMVFRKDLPAVAPSVVSHEDGGSYNKPPLLTIIGHANDKLYIYDQDTNILKEESFNGLGVYKFNTLPYVDYGLNVFKFRAQDGAKFSKFVTFGFNLRRPPAVTPTPEPTPEEEPEETNTNTNENINENINTNIPVNANINSNLNKNTNQNTNQNLNVNEPVLTSEEEQWLDIITEDIIEKYNNDQKKSPPTDLPHLTTEKEPLTETQKQELITNLSDTIKASQKITARVNGELINGEVMPDGSLKFKLTREYDISSLLRRLLNVGGIIISEDSLIIEGQIPQSQIKNAPAYAFVIVYSDPVIKMAQVDKDGRWTITIPLELIPPGEHTAFAQTEVNGTKSQQVELAKFAVEEKVKLSKTTWLVIINVAIAMLLLLTAIIVQMIRNKRTRNTGGVYEK
jgi:parallel beta-helix repeat protein